MEAIIDLFLGLSRMAPGSQQTTAQAYQIAAKYHAIERIVEFGCGSGAATISLAKLSGAHITAVDNAGPFLSQLRQKVEQAGLADQVDVLEQGMDVAWPEGTVFDLIWCEGSAYAVGVEKALRQWRDLLRPGGRIAWSDLVWIDPNPDEEVRQYWQEQGEILRYRHETIRLASACGYRMIDDFVFPETDWQNYYEPLRKHLPKWKSEYSDPEKAGMIAQIFQEEMRMHDRFGSQYGYAFFIAQRAC